MGKELVGYISGEKLTNAKGKDTGWRVHRSKATHQNAYGEKSSTMLLVKESKRGERYDRFAGGYWLGPGQGDLFRGEIADGSGVEGLEEAEDLARSLSDYWAQLDAEDAEKFENEEADY